MRKKPELAVVIDPYDSKRVYSPTIDGVMREINKLGINAHIVTITHKAWNPDGNKGAINALKDKYPGRITPVVVDGDEDSYALAYLKGLQKGAQVASKVIEMDSGGSHDPKEMSRFIEGLDNYDIVFSSRFMKGGVDNYPLQRQISSKGVTILSNFLLGTRLTDVASGYEAFRSEVLADLFKAVPPEEWLSFRFGPMHMFQTEIRSLLSWQNKYDYTEVPISYGLDKAGVNLPISYLAQAVVCFIRLKKHKAELQSKITRAFK